MHTTPQTIANAFLNGERAHDDLWIVTGDEIWTRVGNGAATIIAGHHDDGVVWVSDEGGFPALYEAMTRAGYQPAGADDPRFVNFSRPHEFWTPEA
jgi:hypothetical protein